jgi:hypothetical protein
LRAADAAHQVYSVFADMAAALSAPNAEAFMADFAKSMPGYNRLSLDVVGLLREYLVQSSVDLNMNEGDDRRREVVADWLMQLSPIDAGTFNQPLKMASVKREENVKATLVKAGRKWKVVALAPLDFFAPPPA